MSSTTKKTQIDPESKKIVDEQLTTDDMYRQLADFERHVKEDSTRRKKRLARELHEKGDNLVEEIVEKRVVKDTERNKLVIDIYKISGENFVTMKDAKTMENHELKKILIKAQEANKPWYRNIIDLIMGW